MSSNNDETDVLLSSRSNIYVPNHFEYGEMMSASIYPFSLNHFSAGFHSVDFVMMSQLMPDDTVFFLLYKSRPKEGEVSSHFLRRKYREKLNFHFPCSSGSTLHGVEPLFYFISSCVRRHQLPRARAHERLIHQHPPTPTSSTGG